MTKILLLTAFVGHLLCAWCDRLLICTPSGKFGFAQMSDNEKMAETFEKMPLRNPMTSILLGVLAMTMELCGYIGLYEWMKPFSAVYAVIILASAILLFMPGVVHHVFCGVLEWFYIRLGRTENARQTVVEFFRKTSATMYVCFLGQAIFAVAFFVAVVSGQTALPQWCCIWNIVIFLIALAPFKIPGSGNLAGAAMFLGLFFFI